jgi:hypothetical protein
LWRQSHTENTTTALGLLNDFLDLQPAELDHTCEEGPLVRPWFEVLIEKDTVRLFPWPLLQRQRDQVAESSVRHRVLIRKESIVRIQTEIRSAFHRLGENVRSEAPGQRGRNRLREKEPHMSAAP